MHITQISTHVTLLGGRNHCLVRVDTDDGLYGWGESGLATRELAVSGAVRHLTEWLIGQDPMRRGALWQEMYRSQYFEGGRVLVAAISAIDVALHDISGKALGVPVHQLLGGNHRVRVPCFATCRADPIEVQKLVDDGWPAIRIGPSGGGSTGAYDPRCALAQAARSLITVRDAVGPDVVLGLDVHARLSVAEAVSLCQRLPAGTLDFLEDPIRSESAAAYRALRSMCEIPLAVGEHFASKMDFAPFLEDGLIDLARIDVANVGGLTEAMKVAGWAEAHYVDVMPHNPLTAVGSAATVHLAAAIPNLAWMEIRASPTEDLGFYDSDAFPVQPHRSGAYIDVPTGAGLGVEVDLAALPAAGPLQDVPRLRRSDGSLTNW